MKIQRTIPPTAAMINLTDLLHGIAGFLLGKKYLRDLEAGLRQYFGVKHVFLVSSGKAALTIILKSLQSLSPEKCEVLIPAYTCYSVPSAIIKAGLKVSLCDINPTTFDFDHALLEHAISDKTLCIVPTHLFGIPANVEKVKSMSRHRGIYVVEDAAQAMGGQYNWKKLGTLGDVGFFSLGRGKNITCGSGGIIVTDSDRIKEAIRPLYNALERPRIAESVKEFFKIVIMSIFIRPSLYWLPAGLPFLKLGHTIFRTDFPMKMLSGMQAGILIKWQRRLEESNRVRTENAKFFFGMSDGKSGQYRGKALPFLRVPLMTENRETRDNIYREASRKGIGISLMYPTPINEIKELEDRYSRRTYRSAKKIVECLVTVPTHYLLSEKDKKAIRQMMFKAYPRIELLEYKKTSE